MSVKQSFRLYDIVNKYFRNEEDSKTLVYEIEEIMNNKIELKISDLATKRDISDLKTDMERGFKDQLKWTIVLMLSFASIIVTVIKLL
jgi:hypothetical protein